MARLAVLVPSRARPHNVKRLIDACKCTCAADTVLHFGFDDDDPELTANLAELDWNATATVRPRMGLAAWTNELWQLNPDVPYLASIGDDMVPVTDGWDTRLIDACGTTGMAYPNDGRRDDIPEAVVMTSDIPRALGWMCQPTIGHWYTDNVWSDLGRGAGCITYLPDVVVEHRHPNVPGGDPADQTYWDASPGMAADLAAYQRWRLRDMRADIGKVRALL